METLIRVNTCRIRKVSKMTVRRIIEGVMVIIHVAKTQKWREKFLDEHSWYSVVKMLIHGEEACDHASERNKFCTCIVSLFVGEFDRDGVVVVEEFYFGGRLDVVRIVYSVDEHSLEQLGGEIWK